MKLIINIPEDVYTRLFDNGIQDNEIAIDDICEMARSLRLGTPIHNATVYDIEPCDDAISRILKRMWNCRGKNTTSIDKIKMEQIIRDALPSVTVWQTGCDKCAMNGSGSKYCDNCKYKRTSICGNCKDFDEFEEIDFVQPHKKIPVTLDLTPCDDVVSRGVFEQVMRERDIAIEQLKELGYELGQKIEPCDDAISREAVLNTLDNMDKALDENRTVKEYKALLKECYKALPPVNVRQTAKWIATEDGFECSECGCISRSRADFLSILQRKDD